MVDPTEESMGRPFLRDVSFREALSYDLVSFIVGILFLFVILCLFLLMVYVGWFGGPPPRESPEEILLGLLIITGFVAAILRFRVFCITKTLRNGEVVVAEVLRGSHHQNFVYLYVRYTVGEKVIQKEVWLPNTKGPRALIKEKRLFLAVPLERPRRVVVRNLYV